MSWGVGYLEVGCVGRLGIMGRVSGEVGIQSVLSLHCGNRYASYWNASLLIWKKTCKSKGHDRSLPVKVRAIIHNITRGSKLLKSQSYNYPADH